MTNYTDQELNDELRRIAAESLKEKSKLDAVNERIRKLGYPETYGKLDGEPVADGYEIWMSTASIPPHHTCRRIDKYFEGKVHAGQVLKATEDGYEWVFPEGKKSTDEMRGFMDCLFDDDEAEVPTDDADMELGEDNGYSESDDCEYSEEEIQAMIREMAIAELKRRKHDNIDVTDLIQDFADSYEPAPGEGFDPRDGTRPAPMPPYDEYRPYGPRPAPMPPYPPGYDRGWYYPTPPRTTLEIRESDKWWM